MDLNKLYFFKVTAELEHITRAAEQLGIQQAFLSRSIHTLEEELDAPLFFRSGRGISLSPFGRTYYSYVCSVFDTLEDGARALRDLRQEQALTLHIGTNACSFLPEFFSDLRGQTPGTTIRQRTNALQPLIKELEEGGFDFLFVVSPEPVTVPVPLSARLLLEDRMGLLLPAGHPLSARKALHFHDIASLPLITAPEGYGMTDCLLFQFKAHDVQPNIAVETTDIAIIPKYVAGGLGISALPDTIWRKGPHKGTVHVALAEARFPIYLYLLWNGARYQSRAAQDFLLRAKDYYGKL